MDDQVDVKDQVTHISDINGKKYMTDAKGSLVPIEVISPTDKLMDETVRKIIGHADDLSEIIKRFKGHSFEDVSAFQSLIEQEYGKKVGGKKGNITLTSFDGCLKVQVQVADLFTFGPELQVAKGLIDECLNEWSENSRVEIRALVNKVFQVDKEGNINRAELFMLLRVNIDDARWNNAMDAIRNSIRIIGSKEYLRFYRRANPNDKWKAVSIDIAATD